MSFRLLLICHQQGLLGNEMFAIDGCKISSDAAKEWSGTIKELQKKREKLKGLSRHHLKENRKLDEQENHDEERMRRTQQTIETLDKAFDKVDKFPKTSEPKAGSSKRKTEVKVI
ncbi:MAG: hypothetical protein GY786_09105 [Proteobacteria bacterium]|nr:hypothetical protein [Pseudomonadota bacterium]